MAKSKKKKPAVEEEEEEDYDHEEEEEDEEDEEGHEEEEDGEGEEDDEEAGEEDEENGQNEEDDEDDGAIALKKVKKMEEQTEAQFARIETRFRTIEEHLEAFIGKFTGVLDVHSSYQAVKNSGGWCPREVHKTDSREMQEKFSALEKLVLGKSAKTTVQALEKRIAAMETGTDQAVPLTPVKSPAVIIKDDVGAPLRPPSAPRSGRTTGRTFESIESSGRPDSATLKPMSKTTKKLLDAEVLHFRAEAAKETRNITQWATAELEELRAKVQEVEQMSWRVMKVSPQVSFGAASQDLSDSPSTCVACGVSSRLFTAPSGQGNAESKQGSGRNGVGAPVTLFLSREWDHTPARPSMKKGGGFNTSASHFFGEASLTSGQINLAHKPAPLLQSKSSPNIPRRKPLFK